MRNSILYAILSAVLLSLGWLELSGLTLLVALVPLLRISEKLGSSRKEFWQMALYCSIAFGLWSGATTWWVWNAAAIGAILSVTNTILLFGGIFMLFHFVSKRASRSLAYTILVCGWIAMEMLYTYGEISFPWLMLGNGFANDVKLIQWYEYVGVFGGSLWVLIANISVYTLLKRRSLANIIGTILVLVVPMVISLIMYYNYSEKGEKITVQVVQPNIDPYEEKFSASQEDQNQILISLASKAPADVNYIVMPETAIDDRVTENDLADNSSIAEFREFIRQRYPNAQLIIGATTFRYYHPGERISYTARTNENIDFWYDVYNSALAIDSSNRTQIHHKSKLVVGVEKIPYRSLTKHLDFLAIDLGGITGQLGVDSVRRVFPSPSGRKMGSAICYEGIYGAYFAEFARNGAQVMSIVSNDGWWGNTPGHRQLVGFSRLRAIETRRAIARSANTGISVIINQRGDILAKSGWWVRDSLTGEIYSNDYITFYVRYGDLIGRISVFTFLLSMLYYIAYRTRKRSHLI